MASSSRSSDWSSCILVELWIKAQYLLLQAWSAVLSSAPAQAFLTIMVCPLIEPTLLVGYGILRHVVGPWSQELMPRCLRTFVWDYYLPMICFLLSRLPLISVALGQLGAILLLALTKNTKYYSNLRLFVYLKPQQAVRLGSGSFYNPDNCFHSAALSRGPSGSNRMATDNDDDTTAGFINNLHISQSLLYMCILSYHSHLYRPCIQAGMLPSTSLYATPDGQLIHIICHQTWAVVILNPFQGSNWWNLLFDDRVVTIAAPKSPHGDAGIPATTRASVYNLMLQAGNSPLQYHHVQQQQSNKQHRLKMVTVFQFLRYLSRQGVKLYVTGHSLAGAMANLLALHLNLVWNVTVSAVVTFGAPPIAGNEAFCELYANSVDVSWRLEHGVEIGPFIPLPMMRYRHVGRLIHVPLLLKKDCLQQNDTPDRTNRYSLEYLDEIAETEQLPIMFLDHNPFETLRQLQAAATTLYNQLSRDLWSERVHSAKRDLSIPEDEELTDSDSDDQFYSAHGTPLDF